MNKEIVLMYEMIFLEKILFLHMFSNKSPASSNSLLITSPLTCVVVVINNLFITKKLMHIILNYIEVQLENNSFTFK